MKELSTKYSYNATHDIHELKIAGLKRHTVITFDSYEQDGFVMPILYQGLHDVVAELCFDFQLMMNSSDLTDVDGELVNQPAQALAAGYADFILRVMAMGHTPISRVKELTYLVNRLSDVIYVEHLIRIVSELHETFSPREKVLLSEGVQYKIAVRTVGELYLQAVRVATGRIANDDYCGDIVVRSVAYNVPALGAIIETLNELK